MQNFNYMTSTRLIFGKDVIEQLPMTMSSFGKRNISGIIVKDYLLMGA